MYFADADPPTRLEAERDEQTGPCEDYPCCGHTPDDPCTRQWYDEPDAFDTTKYPHALCDHENGDCNVDYEEDYDDE